MIHEILANANAHKVFIQNLYNKSPNYPKYISGKQGDFTGRSETVWASTILRVKHDGIWYKWHFVETRINSEEKEVVNALIHKVYIALLFGKIDPDLTDIDGDRLWREDGNQQSEKERLLDG